MKKEEVEKVQYSKILDFIISALMKNGLKGTSMDSLASALQMSKRTLYEIFGSKENMFREVHDYFHKKIFEKFKDIFNTSQNVMEAIIRSFLYNRDLMSNLSADFFREMEDFANKNNIVSKNHKHHHDQLYEILKNGVAEGYFRDDINLRVQCKMLSVQMQALKNTEELFPEDITLLDVYDSISIGFLRGISSPKGLAELEKYMPLLSNIQK